VISGDGGKRKSAVAVTILDVIEGFFGELPDPTSIRMLSRQEIENFGELVVESASASAGQPCDDAPIYPGGWLSSYWGEQAFRGDLNLALLYQPRLLVHEPLADFFFAEVDRIPKMQPLRALRGGITLEHGPRAWARPTLYVDMKDDLESVRGHLSRTIGYLAELAPLLRSGVIVARAQWPTILEREQAIMTSARHDVRSVEMVAVAEAAAESGGLHRWDNLRGANVTISGGFVPADRPWQWQPEFFYLAKTLAIADAAGAIYAPSTEDELRLLRTKSRQLGAVAGQERLPVEVLREISRVLLPDMQLDATTAVAMRLSAEGFDDWRRSLRALQRQVGGATEVDLRQQVEDVLIPQVREVERAISRSTVMRNALQEGAATAVITGAVGAISSSQGGQGMGPVGLAGLGSGVLQWLWNAYRPRPLEGAQAVLASLMRKGREEPGLLSRTSLRHPEAV